ncbi:MULTISPECIES: GNAT family N-acetyltransferase [unclassified Streptomyces]|uniref:GNAT family N-acetyltransferase n=1 Tax=unclassified Streptomyces TaxID=2593676 RepID=UPI00210C32BD|nr:GNAT family N-acetyltransferase [Streptomyces sp. DvalAA-14]
MGGGVAVSMRRDPTGFWSKALGMGFDEPVTADLIEEVCAFYRAQETPSAVLQLAPSVLPENWAEICAKAGLSAGSTWLKLAGETDVVVRHASASQRPPTGLRVAAVENGQAGMWGSVMLRAFGMPEGSLAEMAGAAVGRPGWHSFATWDGSDLVGGGAMHVHQDTAQFFSGATLPQARGRGGQSALLAARARAAQAAGCGWLIAETRAGAPGSRNSSLHNTLRLGFRVLYERQDWIWRPTGGE